MQDKDYLVLQRGAETKQNYDVFHVFSLYFKHHESTAKPAMADSFHTRPNSLLTQPHFHLTLQHTLSKRHH
jgi:hypothetical protein